MASLDRAMSCADTISNSCDIGYAQVRSAIAARTDRTGIIALTSQNVIPERTDIHADTLKRKSMT